MAKGMNLSGLGALFGSEALIDDEVECALLPIAKLSAASGQARKQRGGKARHARHLS